MGKRWTPEDEKIMAAHYTTAGTVDEVAKMLKRSRMSVFKKGELMGLKRSGGMHAASVLRIKKFLSDKPQSTAELAVLMHISQKAVNDVLRLGHKEGLCHIEEYRPARGRGKDAPMWVFGPGENATNDLEIEREEREAHRRAHAAKPFKAFRDPFVAQFYGDRAAA